MWKRGEIAPKEQFLLFSIYISNFRSQITYSFVKCGCSIYCFPHSLEVRISRSVSVSPLEFEITRVDCISLSHPPLQTSTQVVFLLTVLKGTPLLHFFFVRMSVNASVPSCLSLFDLVSERVLPVSILHKSIAGRYRPVRVADGLITARYGFIKYASWPFLGNFVYVLLVCRCNCSLS